MYSPYGFHSMTKQYRELALRDAQTLHLEQTSRETRGLWRLDPAWRIALAPLISRTRTAG